jgi:hypothetical protein
MRGHPPRKGGLGNLVCFIPSSWAGLLGHDEQNDKDLISKRW